MILFSMLLAVVSSSPVSAARIRQDVRALSSDAFGGRGPGEVGETRSIDYLVKQFAAAGLEPGGPGGSWLQDMPLVRIDRTAGAELSTALTFTGSRQLPRRDRCRVPISFIPP